MGLDFGPMRVVQTLVRGIVLNLTKQETDKLFVTCRRSLVKTQYGIIWNKNRHVNVCLVYDRNFCVFKYCMWEGPLLSLFSALSHTHQGRSVSFVYASCCGQQSCAHWQSYLSHSLNTLDRLWGWGPAQNMCLRTAILTHGNWRQRHAFSLSIWVGSLARGLITLCANDKSHVRNHFHNLGVSKLGPGEPVFCIV